MYARTINKQVSWLNISEQNNRTHCSRMYMNETFKIYDSADLRKRSNGCVKRAMIG